MIQTLFSSPRMTLLLGVMLVLSCSLSLDFEECEIDSDCRSLAAPGQSLACSSEGYCVEANECTVDADCASKAPRIYCQDSGVCGVEPNNNQTSSTGTNTGGTNTTGECCSNSSCAQENGDNFVCNSACECVSLLSEECFVVEGPVSEDNTVIIGSILPTQGQSGEIGKPMEQAVRLAVNEINQAGGLGGGRSLALVGCDSSGDNAKGLSAVDHLVDTVNVPALVGPAFSGVLVAASARPASGKDIMFVSPSATAAAITTLDDNGLVWRTIPSDDFQGGAIAQYLRDIFEQEGVAEPEVVVLGKDDTYGIGLVDKLTVELSNSTVPTRNFISRVYNVTGDDVSDAVAKAQLAFDTSKADGRSGGADFVLLMGTNEVVDVLREYERLCALDATITCPRYIVSDGGRVDSLIEYVTTENLEVLTRLRGVYPDTFGESQYPAFQSRFQRAYEGANPAIYASNAYDATYMLAYGLMTLDAETQPTGSNLAQSMSKLVTGESVGTGSTEIGKARNLLQSGNSVDYDGASGPVDFDLETGDVIADVLMWELREERPGDYVFTDILVFRANEGSNGTWSPVE